MRRCAPVLALAAAFACSPDEGATAAAPRPTPTATPLCRRPAADAVRDVFCNSRSPAVSGLVGLEKALGIDFMPDDAGAPDGAGYGYASSAYSLGLANIVLLGHSTSLSANLVSPINPRAILFGPTTFVAFNRGVQQVELAAQDRHTGHANLYLVTFRQSCNDAGGGCTYGDLYTPSIESNWTSVTLQDAEDLKNTPADCRQCHQRGEAAPLLLMRELDGPWTHFFAPESAYDAAFPDANGADLLKDYIAAKGDEEYAGVPSSLLRSTIGFSLEQHMGLTQPIIFDSGAILNERWPYDANADQHYPSTPVRSATWDAAFAAFQRGEQLALPFYAPRATDPAKQAQLTDAYQNYRAGTLALDALPDFGDIFPDDPKTRTDIGLETSPDATPATALIEACGPCHNDVLDQTISRARFNIALSRLSRGEIDEAVARLRLPRSAPGSMPPPGRRQIQPTSLPVLIDYLSSSTRSADDDALLERAAEHGMLSHQTLSLD